jgi:hypothetical protein
MATSAVSVLSSKPRPTVHQSARWLSHQVGAGLTVHDAEALLLGQHGVRYRFQAAEIVRAAIARKAVAQVQSPDGWLLVRPEGRVDA